MVQCRECNSEVSDKAKFCPKCRTPLKSNEDTPKSPKIASDKKGGFNPILIVAIIAIVAIVALGAGYLLYGRWLARKWGIDENAFRWQWR